LEIKVKEKESEIEEYFNRIIAKIENRKVGILKTI